MAIKRFAAAGGNGSSNWIRAGKTVANESSNIFDTATAYGNDYGGMARSYMAAQSSQRQAATKAQSAVYKQGLAATAQVTNAKTNADADKYVNKLKTKSKMAGKLAAYGGTLAKSFQKDEPPAAPILVDPAALAAARDKANTDNGLNPDGTPVQADAPTPPATDGTEIVARSTDSPDLGGGITGQGGGTVTHTAYTPPAAGKIYTKAELETLAVQGGFKPEDAPLVAQIAIGESSGNPNAFNGVGADQSYGLMQINMLGDMGPERRAQFGISSNEELNDPLKNMQAAHAIYQQQGWGAWGAYTNGSYRNY